MPYKDPERRRAYHREYKRRQRAGLSNPSQPQRKAYLCPQHPFFQGGGFSFTNGFYVTDIPEKQALIEANKWYGVYIFSCRVEQ